MAISDESDDWGSYLVNHHVFENIFVGLQPVGQLRRRAWSGQVELALAYTRETFPALGYLCDLLITNIVLLNSTSTGSASHLPGLVAISPGPNWGTYDFAETIVHEITHLNLFILDMVNKLYQLPTEDLARQENRVVSAVKIGELRPFDKAFHSAVVAVPLMYMQDARGDSALVDAFAEPLKDCCQGLETERDPFTPYGQTLLDELSEFARTLDFGMVETNLTRDGLAA
ncbi:aKG-HExxH-type peptide beta-hydroxylase [Spirillospora sp. CA-294931]|uniref:aKG-HExxH-type peptide beta-hydroxylase n=1 Tax=Spirillospora sp. CA-294931 TaxID=3240042 RepID=UPI003D9151F5